MQKSLSVSSEAPASETAPLYALAQTLQAHGLAQGAWNHLYLRFEPMARLAAQPVDPKGQVGDVEVGVMATWRARSLRHGDVDCVLPMEGAEAQALVAACAAAGLRVINHLPKQAGG